MMLTKNKVFLCAFTAIACLKPTYSTQSLGFVRLPSASYNVTIEMTLTLISDVSCVRHCLALHRLYGLYNAVSKSCSCGSVRFCPSILTESDQIFGPQATLNCDLDSGFIVHRVSSSFVCLKAAATHKKYQDAQTDCQGYANGRLFVTDTIDKMAIGAGLIAGNNGLFVGADDRDVEGTYRWADNRTMTLDDVTKLFNVNEPSNSGGGEDCMEVDGDPPHLLNDVNCAASRYYVCEIPVA